MIRETFVVSSLFILVCEDKAYNLVVQKSFFSEAVAHNFSSKMSSGNMLQFTGGDLYGNMISIKLRSTSA